MGTMSNRTLGMPHTRPGWWSVALTLLFVALFYLVTNDIIFFSGFLTISFGVIAGITTIFALIRGERSWLAWLMLLPGLFAILFALGEVLSPH